MNEELQDRIREQIENKVWANSCGDICLAREAAQAVIDLLGLHETTDSLSNDMIRYETKWLKRDD